MNNTTTNLNNLLYQTPNLPHSLVPEGNSDKDNEEVFRSGEIPDLNDDALPHWELAKKFDIIDFELGNKIQSYSEKWRFKKSIQSIAMQFLNS